MKKLLLILFFTLISYSKFYGQIAVIANKSVPIQNLSDIELLDIYSGDVKWWANGDAIIVFDLKTNNEVRTEFYEFIGKTPSRMKSIWMKKMLSGEGEPPETFITEEEILKKVSETKGAIAFVGSDKINESVKIISLIEK